MWRRLDTVEITSVEEELAFVIVPCVAGTTQLGNQIKQQRVRDLHYVRWKVSDPPIALN